MSSEGIERQKKAKKAKDGTIALALPQYAVGIKGRVETTALQVLREREFATEKELLLEILTRDEKAQEYYMQKKDLRYFRAVLWKMAKKGVVKKVKMVGNDKVKFYCLPETLQKYKDYVVKH
ncbi:hypothetical protein GWK48_02910 [Metallosphaera tengchongensis]|uniref:Uncharacterized protein n=1 Tax=Metallosphaera tengchongensis TaxID=1532350 RepID=A0A6N0NUA5_9CREN|nr:hypothetical protein [Metallosphaera tengchongensis]QKQ99482.1 hypothetical protein GWK48_02910 [Metallosphaera tengchongensis]